MAGYGGGSVPPWRTRWSSNYLVRTALCAALVSLSLSTLAHSQEVDEDSADWTAWGEASPCSRSCAVGVSYRERTCRRLTDDGSPACVGPARHYTTCNIQDCPDGSKDFRLQQCEHYNNISFDGEYYEWVPYYGGAKKCELNCLAKGETFYYRHAAKVADGTPCDLTSQDICIDGVCQAVGCDLMLGSNLRLDNCGNCGGDGSSCRTYEGHLDTDHLKSGYNDLILIPAGAMSITFKEVSPGNNYLALRDMAGSFFLNGDWRIQSSHDFEAGGSSFSYKRGAHPSDLAESLSAQGPTTQALFFSVLRQPGPSPQVSYEYSLPLSVQGGTSHTYSWVPAPWVACSSSCGAGDQTRTLSCQRSSDLEVVADSLCDPHHKPDIQRPCNVKPCPASWHVGYWEPCSTTCGEGARARSVFCQRKEKGDLFTMVTDDHCQGPKPTAISKCNHDVLCPKWQVGKWSKCNRVCGLGQQTRTVYCLARHPLPDAASDILPSGRCHPADEPISAQECNEGPCDGLEWVVSSWSGCLGECGQMAETRQVVCSSKVGEVFNNSMCDGGKRPATTRPCPHHTTCDGHTEWHASQWSQCSALCGPGVQTRSVTCVQVEDGIFRTVDESECDASLRMHDTQNCTGESCWGIWFQGPWGKCSAECGTGKMKREVLCFYGDQVATLSDCDEASKPITDQPCNMEACDDENEVGGCKGTEFGCCPDGETEAEGPEFFGCQVKDRIPTGSCVEAEYGCCLDGVTAAQGPFNAGCPYFTCKDMIFGCCPDGQTPAGGPLSEGCPEQFGCAVTAYGCCPDGVIAANGFKNEGCEAPIKTCSNSPHGCCPDGVTEAIGPEQAGCDGSESSGEVCEETPFGCCGDRLTAATGPNQEGCNEISASCGFSLYGCCPDEITAAEGPNSQGCPGVILPPVLSPCASTTYGCCPDGEAEALGPDGYGCDKIEIDCSLTTYGCCPDGTNIAHGDHNEGCPAECLGSEFGCCPDGTTSATGPNDEGCHRHILVGGCAGTRHGCCPDNTTSAHGPYFFGCNVTKLVTECDMTSYGCCLDGETVAAGPDFIGCQEEGTYRKSCIDSPYGCCPDGISPADGPSDAGCPSLIDRGASCGMTSDTGPCSNFTVKWYFDPLMGSCSRYWYGGCEGNDNRFDNREDCQATCVKPEGIKGCYLPKSVGQCRASENSWYYNPEDRECESFVYGGCMGNDNRFKSHEACEQKCISPQSPDVCSQPHMSGPCRGNFERWFYDKTAGQCRQFIYGGCLGNDNRYETRELCEQRCQLSAKQVCQLPQDTGPCRGAFSKFFFDSEIRQCREFMFGGCHGNANRFSSLHECQSVCHELKKVVDVCMLPQDPGPCKAYLQRWHYDPADGYCKQFVYGGCDGNDNKFETEEQCRATCNANTPTNVCDLEVTSGPCEAYMEQFAYDRHTGECVKFVYGGCEGNANRFTSIEECKKICPTSKDQGHVTDYPTTDICRMTRDAGPCFAYQTRFYYDSQEGECVSFTYGGCQGNQNNFATLEECRARCKTEDTRGPATEPTDICSQKLDSGPCYDWESRYFYNVSSDHCEHFFYGGCQGNGNNFASEEECGYYCNKQQPTTTTTTTTTTTSTTRRTVATPEQPVVTDICLLEKDPGPCLAMITKYHYDAQQGTCVQFDYGGCLGNHNNFESREDCEAYCGRTGRVTRPTRPPTTTEVCTQPRDPGPCYGSMRRYHYDPTDGRCLEFVYGGCQGNDNNFLTLDECNNRCGGRAPTATTEDRCQQSKDSGPCLAYMPRYFYDSATGQCKQFIYGGCQGNRNRFMSEEDCREVCRMTDVLPVESDTTTTTSTRVTTRTTTAAAPATEPTGDICQLRKDEGECRGYQPSWYYDAQLGRCIAFVWGGCGGNANRFENILDCRAKCGPRTEPPVQPTEQVLMGLAVCGLRSDPGPCRESVSRWYYDYEDGLCKQFVYGGCRGNENNFDTKEECKQACPVEAICQLPSETGRCRAAKRRYFYDYNSGECQLFTYGGCEGNANRFLQKDSCDKVCATEGGPIEVMPPGEETDVCTLNMDAGPCAAYTRFWFYNAHENLCREFTYGGCLGNGNRFATEEECSQHCRLEGVVRTTQPTRPTQTTQPRTYTPRTYTSRTYTPKSYTSRTYTPRTYTPRTYTEKTYTPKTYTPRATTQSTRIASTTTVRYRTDYPEGDICTISKDPGPCTDYEPVWYFEPNSRTCRRFLYGGCEGNGNRFDSRLACEESCLFPPGHVTTVPPTWHPHTTKATPTESSIEFDVCSLTSDAGPCRDNIQVLWFYNEEAQECHRFLYGGCQGNANRFQTQKECEKICVLRQRKDVCEKPADKGPCNETQQRWHYDPSSQACQQFVYGGCEGNSNRFDTELQCRQVCGQREPQPTAPTNSSSVDVQPTKHTEQTKAKDACTFPAEAGPCSASVRKWYYNTDEARCLEFTYGGCLGNDNQFDSEADCQNYCGSTIAATEPPAEPTDVCEQPSESGPCFADYLRFFYDSQNGQCRPFIYGGCQANDNNFETQEDCYSRCGDPSTEHVIRKPGDCYLAPDPGPCRAAEKRYHFDPAQGDCVAFYYGGCEGNGNNFFHYQDCIAMCTKATVSCGVLQCDLRCPGEYARGPDGCLQCRCRDPCEGHRCGEGYECQVQQIQCITQPCPPDQAVCVPKQKEGECPALDVLRMGSCDRPCEQDADCPGPEKCCTSSCGPQCAAPAGPAEPLPQCPPMEGELAITPVKLCARDSDCPQNGRCCVNTGLGQVCLPAAEILGCAGSVFGCCPDGETPSGGYNFQGCPEEEPEIYDSTEVDRMAVMGSSLVLTCSSRGSPRPQITWYKDGFPVLADDTGRYAEIEDDSLEIREVESTDNAIFTCRAYNGVGSSATKAYTVTVSEPVTFGEMQSVVTVDYGGTAMLHCMAYGKPTPRITWLKGGAEVFYDGTRVLQAANNTLIIRSATPADQGDYICEARNDVGRPEQRIIVLSIQDFVPPREPLRVLMTGQNKTHNVGGDVRLLCIVTGDGDVRTTWTKDGQDVAYDGRVKTTAEGELLIEDVVHEDEGTYRCTATRGRETTYVETGVRVAGLRLPGNCEDKPWLANCALIVQARLCRHHYFSDFCCESCHKAGLLP